MNRIATGQGSMDHGALLDAQFAEHLAILEKTRLAVRDPFRLLVGRCIEAARGGGRIFFFGNGGSAADAQHLAAELVVRYTRNRQALAAIALTTDSSVLTACANDFAFDAVFARQIEALARPGDVAIGISTSGKSASVLKALRAALAAGAVAAGFAGRDGGDMIGLADPLLVVPCNVTARIQEMHIILGHSLCDAIEQAFAA